MFSANTRPHQLCWGALASSSDSLLPPFLRREPGDEARGAWEMGTGVSCKNCCKMTAYSGLGTALRLCDELLLWAVTEFTLYNMHMCVLPLVHSLAIIALVESIQQHEINWRKKELEIVPASYGIKQVFKDDNIRWLEGKMNKTATIDVWFQEITHLPHTVCRVFIHHILRKWWKLPPCVITSQLSPSNTRMFLDGSWKAVDFACLVSLCVCSNWRPLCIVSEFLC